MSDQKKIVVVAGNREQFRYWVEHNIIPVTHERDVERLLGIKIDKVYYEGNYYDALDAKSLDKIKYIIATKVK